MPDRDSALSFDLNAIGQDFLDDPFPMYQALREHDPVHRNPDGTWLLTRYEDVVLCFKHPAMSSDKKVDFKPRFGDGPLYTHHTTSLVFNDPPIHTRVRRLLAAAFTPRKIGELEPLIDEVIDDLLDRMAAQGRFDVIQDYALALPTAIISFMLGIPEEHRHRLHDFSTLILGALDPVVSLEKMQAGHAAVEEFGAMLEELIADRRLEPASGGQGEVLAALIFGEVNGEKLSPAELVQNCIFLLNAGHETTANLVGNCIDMLLDYPDQMQRLRDDPALITPGGRGIPPLPEPVADRQPESHRGDGIRPAGPARYPAGRHLHPLRSRRGQPRSRGVRRSRECRYRPQPQPPDRLRHRKACPAWATRWAGSRAGWRSASWWRAFRTCGATGGAASTAAPVSAVSAPCRLRRDRSAADFRHTDRLRVNAGSRNFSGRRSILLAFAAADSALASAAATRPQSAIHSACFLMD